MLLDSARTPASVKCKSPCDSASWKTLPARTRVGGTLIGDIGVSTPESIAADIVMTLFVLPGSKTSDRAEFPRSSAGAAPGSDGSKVGVVAIARICPVRGCITITDPPSAPVAFT